MMQVSEMQTVMMVMLVPSLSLGDAQHMHPSVFGHVYVFVVFDSVLVQHASFCFISLIFFLFVALTLRVYLTPVCLLVNFSSLYSFSLSPTLHLLLPSLSLSLPLSL
eukprot:m.307575 g.307575  ORF g.307575 m.307575 type:complete len:107 (+) comp15935_c0_seq2:2552-2872(+)